jgi:hypothetical protein
MKPSSLMLAAVCIAMLTTTGHAQPKVPSHYSANEVMKGCRAVVAQTNPETEAGWFLRGICMGIVSALAGYSAAFERAARGTTGVCLPEGVSVNQQVRVVVAYIDARPNRLHEDFRTLTIEALRDAWPCKR